MQPNHCVQVLMLADSYTASSLTKYSPRFRSTVKTYLRLVTNFDVGKKNSMSQWTRNLRLLLTFEGLDFSVIIGHKAEQLAGGYSGRLHPALYEDRQM